jgi:hypothetical protein
VCLSPLTAIRLVGALHRTPSHNLLSPFISQTSISEPGNPSNKRKTLLLQLDAEILSPGF